MLARPLAAIRADRRLQVLALAVVLAGAAFAWWTISPLFITTTLVEQGGAGAGKVLSSGELQRVDDVHQGRGPVAIVESGGKLLVRFENVAIQNGPDLQVYLGRGTGGAYDGATDLHLGALKATNGTFSYEIPAGTRIEDYRSVVVWCRAFFTLFTWADLARP